MVQTRFQKTAVFKLDLRSQKAQGIYNTNNSLTGARCLFSRRHTSRISITTKQPHAFGTPQSSGQHEGRQKVKSMLLVFSKHT